MVKDYIEKFQKISEIINEIIGDFEDDDDIYMDELDNAFVIDNKIDLMLASLTHRH